MLDAKSLRHCDSDLLPGTSFCNTYHGIPCRCSGLRTTAFYAIGLRTTAFYAAAALQRGLRTTAFYAVGLRTTAFYAVGLRKRFLLYATFRIAEPKKGLNKK